jgi:hypothetical protein
MTDPIKAQSLYENSRRAMELLNQTLLELDQWQLEGQKGKSQFFEKLAIGSGATIAALVSFLGANEKRVLHPHWILRCALVSLAVALFAALYRNWSYPNFRMAHKERVMTEAKRKVQECRNDEFNLSGCLHNLQTGELMEVKDWHEGFKKSEAELDIEITKRIKEEHLRWKGVAYSENLCLAAVCIAMASLVWLGLRNF